MAQGSFANSLSAWKRGLDLSPENPDIQFSYIGLLMTLGLVEQAKPLATDPFWAANILLLEDRHDELHDKMDFDVEAWPDDPWVAFEAGWYQFLVGDIQKGANLMKRADQFFTDSDRYTMPVCTPAIEIAYAYQVSGAPDRARDYMAKCTARLKAVRSGDFSDSRHDYLAARLAAMSGNPDLAAHELGTAYQNGWREWWVDLDPLLSGASGNADVQATFGKVKAALAVERQKALTHLEQAG